ncbi:MAG: ferritin [Spirochaetes bacterium]|nr:ferritin [Spirochaetota bacterium]
MVINKKIQEAINKQINRELYSSYLYLSMASYFEAIGLKGFGTWMKVQAKEEVAHAMKFYSYLFERAGKVTLLDVEAPPATWKSPLDAFKNAYEHEKKVTEMIDNIMKIARTENDYATETMLGWFIDEQVEEEASALEIVGMLEMIKDTKTGLFMLDSKLGQRGSEK